MHCCEVKNWKLESQCIIHAFLRENLLARQALEHTLAHTGATDLDVAMFHRNGGTLTHNNLHAWTYTLTRKNYTPCLVLLKCLLLDITVLTTLSEICIRDLFFSQVRIQTLILTSHWRRREVCPSRLLRARTTFVCADASIGASSVPLTASVCSQNKRKMVEKVLLSSFAVICGGVAMWFLL